MVELVAKELETTAAVVSALACEYQNRLYVTE